MRRADVADKGAAGQARRDPAAAESPAASRRDGRPVPPAAPGRDAMRPVTERIEDAVFSLMEATDIPDIRVGDVVRRARTSRSTFYRHFESVDAVVKAFELDLLSNMHQINTYALKARFGEAELQPTASMVRRMEFLRERRDKIVALNGPHGDPQFTHKATVLMHDHFRSRLEDVGDMPVSLDLYLAFAIAGHNNLIQYWLEKRPDIDPAEIAAALNRLFYAPILLGKDESVGARAPRAGEARP